jgi:tRNA (guanine-N7-)-methyltransferase
VLVPWRTRSFPIDWEAEFGRPCAPTLEIGFGDGRYTVRTAHERPEACLVGIEISSVSLQRALRRVKRDGVGNVRLAKAGARFALRQLFAEHSLERIVVNFPDPWPKERHVARRLLSRDFFRLAASRLQVGGAVCLATDHADYLAFAMQECRAADGFEAREANAPPAVFETKYALKWKAQGIPLRYVEFRFSGGPTDAFPILERPSTMPHALLSGSLPETAPFTKVVLAYADGHVILHEVARSFGPASEAGDVGAPPAERWWVRASVDEPDIRQHLLVVVQQRSSEQVIVRLEPFGDPVITATVRGAVHAVTQWLLSATGLRLEARNY